MEYSHEGMGYALKIFAIIFILLFAITIGFQYLKYKEEVKLCCKMYREYILDGSNDGWCEYISFIDYLKDVRGCAIVDYNEEGYRTTLNGGAS